VIKVSVIIPIYNVEAYIEECLRSALKQTLRDIEIICVDDGSTDNTPTILKRLQQEDSRIRLFWQENAGQSVARNYGMHEARGEYIAFLDSDDLFVEQALEHAYSKVKTDDLDILFYEADTFYDPPELYEEYPSFRDYYHFKKDYGPLLSGQELFVLLRKNGDFKPSVCLQLRRRAFLEENQISFFPGIIHQDNLFTLQSLMLAKQTGALNELLYRRRVRPGSTMTGEQGWRDVFGYLVCILELGKSLASQGIEEGDFKETITKYQELMGRSAGKALLLTSGEDLAAGLAALPLEEHAEFTLLLGRIQKEAPLLARKEKRKKKMRALETRLESSKVYKSERLGRLFNLLFRFVERILRPLIR